MGPTGVGKSTVGITLRRDIFSTAQAMELQFINTVCGTTATKVNHGLDSCTTLLKPVVVNIPKGPFRGRRLVLVDTPGFDDTLRDDSEILHRIAFWLAAS
jgi:hypothetical protein